MTGELRLSITHGLLTDPTCLVDLTLPRSSWRKQNTRMSTKQCEERLHSDARNGASNDRVEAVQAHESPATAVPSLVQSAT